MFWSLLGSLRERHPLIHTITNIVAANDSANILLAAGAAPIMADCPQEVREITGIAQGLCLNMGTPNPQKIEAMRLSGMEANALGIPAVLDPVGVGASEFRKKAAGELLKQVRFTAIRGNLAEIRTLAHGSASGRGVDADEVQTAEDPVALAKEYSQKTSAIVVITGKTDVVTDGKTVYCIQNGHPMMGAVTGSGCMLSALLTAFLAANPLIPLEAAAAAVCAMGLAGEIAYSRLLPGEGNASYRNRLIDAIYSMTPENLQEGARYEVR